MTINRIITSNIHDLIWKTEIISLWGLKREITYKHSVGICWAGDHSPFWDDFPWVVQRALGHSVVVRRYRIDFLGLVLEPKTSFPLDPVGYPHRRPLPGWAKNGDMARKQSNKSKNSDFGQNRLGFGSPDSCLMMLCHGIRRKSNLYDVNKETLCSKYFLGNHRVSQLSI